MNRAEMTQQPTQIHNTPTTGNTHNMYPTIEPIEFQILGVYACAIINGDYSAMSADESEQLAEWAANIAGHYGSGHWSVNDDRSNEFARCSASSIYGSVIGMDYVRSHPKRWEIGRAYDLVNDLVDHDCDGNTYEVELDPNGGGEFAFVKVFDAENGFTGYWE